MENQNVQIDIRKFLPHRSPMLMADTLLAVEDLYAEGIFDIPLDCIFLQNQKTLSETGLLEHAAQICSAVLGKKFFSEEDVEGESNKVVGYISTVKKLKIYQLPNVFEQIVTKANLISLFDAGDYSTCSIEAKTFNNNEELLLDCTLNFLIHEI